MSGIEQASGATWYKIDGSTIPWDEFRREKPLITCLLLYPLKFIGAVTGADCDPAVDSTTRFLTAPDAVAPEALDRLKPGMDALAELGFAQPVYHSFADPVNYATYDWATMRRNSGGILARATMFNHTHAGKQFPQLLLITKLLAGGFVVSSAGEHRCEMPPGVTYRHEPDADAATILAIHEQAVGTRPVWRLTTDELVVEVTEELHRLVMAHNISRGRYILPRQIAPPPVEPYDHLLHTAAARLLAPDKQRKWQANLKLLCITALMFVALLGPATDWMFALMILPVLLFHEAGHWIAMKAFGYGDVRMFFIPMFGAAVSGKKPRIAGWKPVVVYLAGPVPGILLAIPLAIIADRQQIDWLHFFARIMLFINLLNMLPVMPLDGGRVAHALLFQRHYLLDVFFRIFAGAVLIIIGGLATLAMLDAGPIITVFNMLLPILGVVMLLGLPASWAVGRTVRAMRHNLRDDAFDMAGKPTPQFAYEVGLVHRDGAHKKRTAKKALERLVTRSRETIDALGTRPIGILGTLLLGGTYVGMFVVGAIAFVPAPPAVGPMRGGIEMRWTVSPDQIELFGDKRTPHPPNESITLIASFDSHEMAERSYVALQTMIPDGGRMMLFGQTVFVEVPRYDVDRDELRSVLTKGSAQYTESTYDHAGARIAFMFDATDVDVQHLTDQVLGYSAFFNVELVAPWDPAAELTEDQLLARRTIGRCKRLRINYEDPILKLAATQRVSKDGYQVRRNGEEAYRDRYHQLQLEAFEEELAKSDRPLDRDLGLTWLQPIVRTSDRRSALTDDEAHVGTNGPANDDRIQLHWDRLINIAPRLGRHAYGTDDIPDTNFFVSDSLYIGLPDAFTYESKYFVTNGYAYNPIDAIYAHVTWLYQHGAKSMRYEAFGSGGKRIGNTNRESRPQPADNPVVRPATPAVTAPLPADNVDEPRDVPVPVVPREGLSPAPPRSPGS